MESGAGVLMSPRLLAVWLAAVGCAVWLCAGGCAPAAVIGWPLPCALLAFALLAVACGWLPCWPAGWRLCPCPVPVLVEAVRLCPVGGYGGVYIKLPGDYTGRIKPLPARLASLLAACFFRLHRRGSGGHRLAAVLICAPVGGRFSWRPPPVLLLAFASCLLACFGGQRSTASATERHTENAGENAPDFPAPLPDGSRRSRSSTRPGSTAGRRAGDHAGGRRKFPAIFPARYFTRPV